jgi:hypothetical protein
VTNDSPLSSAFEPLKCLVFQGLEAKTQTCCFAAPATNAVVRLHVNGVLLIFNGAHSTDPHGIAIFAIMWTNDVKHIYLLLKEIVD